MYFLGHLTPLNSRERRNWDSYIQNRWINRTRGTRGLKIDAFDFGVNIYLLQCPYNRKAWTSESRMNRCVQHDFILPITMFQTVTMVPYLISLYITLICMTLSVSLTSLWRNFGPILFEHLFIQNVLFRSFRFVGGLLLTSLGPTTAFYLG